MMLPFWLRWVEVARFPSATDADDLQDWLAERGIRSRVKAHRQERPGVGTSVGYQIIPDQASIASHYVVEVRPEDFQATQAALHASGWDTTGSVGHLWLTQGAAVLGVLLTVVIVVGFVVFIGASGAGS